MIAFAYGNEDVTNYLWISSNVAQIAKGNSMLRNMEMTVLLKLHAKRRITLILISGKKPNNYTALHLATMYPQINVMSILIKH